jgi:hypothetical protein
MSAVLHAGAWWSGTTHSVLHHVHPPGRYPKEHGMAAVFFGPSVTRETGADTSVW